MKERKISNFQIRPAAGIFGGIGEYDRVCVPRFLLRFTEKTTPAASGSNSSYRDLVYEARKKHLQRKPLVRAKICSHKAYLDFLEIIKIPETNS